MEVENLRLEVCKFQLPCHPMSCAQAALLEHLHGIRNMLLIIEQPITSMLFETPELLYIATLFGLYRLALNGRGQRRRSIVLTNLPRVLGNMFLAVTQKCGRNLKRN